MYQIKSIVENAISYIKMQYIVIEIIKMSDKFRINFKTRYGLLPRSLKQLLHLQT